MSAGLSASRPRAQHSDGHATPGRYRIGVVGTALEYDGGVGSVVEFVCRTIERSGEFEPRIVSIPTWSRDELSVALRRPSSWLRGVATARGTWRGRPFTRIGASLVELEFRRYQPRRALTEALADCDLIQVVCGSPAAACAVCGLAKPVAVHCATRAVVERRSCSSAGRGVIDRCRRGMTKITDRLDRRALRLVDAIQVENAWMLNYVRNVTADRGTLIRFVTPGVDANLFTPAAHRALPPNPYILCVGRLNDPRKNVALLLDAFAALPPRLRSTHLMLAGGSAPPPSFWRRVDELELRDRVRFVASPTQDELVACYQGASAFALSSDEEGFGIVLIEAMASGIPVVSTRSGGPDGFILDGENGFLVDVGDAAALSDRLARLLTDEELNRRMGESGRRSVLGTYDSRTAGEVLLETYVTLLQQRERTASRA